MKFNYYDIENEKLSTLKKKGKEIKYFKPKDFEQYRKDMEDIGETVSVVRNTKLKKYSDKKNSSNDEYITIGGVKYIVTKETAKKAKGFISIEENKFIRIEKSSILPLILLLLLLGGCAGGYYLYSQQPGDNPQNKDLEMDNTDDWDGKTNGDSSTASQESIQIPGFAAITATEKSPLVSLYNVPDNTVNFVYTITQLESEEDAKTFSEKDVTDDETTAVELAQKYATQRSPKYTNNYPDNWDKMETLDKSVEYKLEVTDAAEEKDIKNGDLTDTLIEYNVVDNEDGTYTVKKNTSKVICFSKGIAPGGSKDWDVYSFLEPGTYDLQFRISTFDVETNAPCYGAINAVKVTIA